MGSFLTTLDVEATISRLHRSNKRSPWKTVFEEKEVKKTEKKKNKKKKKEKKRRARSNGPKRTSVDIALVCGGGKARVEPRWTRKQERPSAKTSIAPSG
jgi:hypothetical protein